MEIAVDMKAEAREQFAGLLQRHRGLVFKVANGYATNPDDRADLAQDIAAQLWRAWPSYDGRRPVTTWMYRIALNVAISHLRGRSRHQASHVPLEEDLHLAHAESHDHEREQQLRVLQRLIAGFEPMNRALLLLYLDDRSQREISEILGISESNVATKIGRLKQRLRTELA